MKLYCPLCKKCIFECEKHELVALASRMGDNSRILKLGTHCSKCKIKVAVEGDLL